MRRRLLDRMLLPARVRTVKELAPRMRHVALTGPELAGLAWVPGQHVRLQVGAAPGAVDWLIGTLRTYSVWDYDGETIELIVFDHGETGGPGADWARTCQPGDELRLLKPEGNFTNAVAGAATTGAKDGAGAGGGVRAAGGTGAQDGYHLFAGEETASVAFGAMVRALPGDARVFGCLEVDSPEERLDLGRDGDLRWSYRHGRSAASAESLVSAVRERELPPGPGTAYLAGEARTIQLIRRHLVDERGWSRRDVRTKPFWTPGRKGLD